MCGYFRRAAIFLFAYSLYEDDKVEKISRRAGVLGWMDLFPCEFRGRLRLRMKGCLDLFGTFKCTVYSQGFCDRIP